MAWEIEATDAMARLLFPGGDLSIRFEDEADPPDDVLWRSLEGMMDFTESLRKLVDEEYISVKTAMTAAPNPDELKMRLKGISVMGGGIIG